MEDGKEALDEVAADEPASDVAFCKSLKIIIEQAGLADIKCIDDCVGPRCIEIIKKAFVCKDENPDENYEMYEHLGDKLYNEIVASIIVDAMPLLAEDPRSLRYFTPLEQYYYSKKAQPAIAELMGLDRFIRCPRKTKAHLKKLKEDVLEAFCYALKYVIDTTLEIKHQGYSAIFTLIYKYFLSYYGRELHYIYKMILSGINPKTVADIEELARYYRSNRKEDPEIESMLADYQDRTGDKFAQFFNTIAKAGTLKRIEEEYSETIAEMEAKHAADLREVSKEAEKEAARKLAARDSERLKKLESSSMSARKNLEKIDKATAEARKKLDDLQVKIKEARKIMDLLTESNDKLAQIHKELEGNLTLQKIDRGEIAVLTLGYSGNIDWLKEDIEYLRLAPGVGHINILKDPDPRREVIKMKARGNRFKTVNII